MHHTLVNVHDETQSSGVQQEILRLNHINEAVYCKSLYDMFAGGGGKDLNHLYIGAPNTGKTALTRAPLALFGTKAFVKPQVNTSFALEGLIGAEAVILLVKTKCVFF